MCQAKPGLRCNTHAENSFIIASAELRQGIADAHNEDNSNNKLRRLNHKFQQAQRDYWCSEKGLAALSEAGLDEEHDQAQVWRANRQQGVENIKEAAREYEQSEEKNRDDEIADNQLNTILNSQDKGQIEALNDMITSNKEVQSSLDKDLRQKYTDLLDNGDTSNQNLPKSIAVSTAKLERLKAAQQRCSAVLDRPERRLPGASFRGRESLVEQFSQGAEEGRAVEVELRYPEPHTVKGTIHTEQQDNRVYVKTESGEEQDVYSLSYNNFTPHEVSAVTYQ